jgi:hypothetical protein
MTEEVTGEEFTPEEVAALESMKNPDAAKPAEPAPAPEPEAEPAAAEPEPAKAEKEPTVEFQSSREKPPEGMVPHQAMHAERVARQELQRRFDELKERIEAQKPPEAVPEYVDPLVDPEGFRKWDEHRFKTLQEQVIAQRDQVQQVAEFRARQIRVTEYEQTFAEKQSDYKDAAKFLVNERSSELQAMGYDDAAVRRQIATDINQIVTAAESIGMNPAQLAYWRAQERGYKRQEAAPVTGEAEKIVALARAQAETQGVKGGETPTDGYTAKQLAEMSQEEFDKVPEHLRRKAMGG